MDGVSVSKAIGAGFGLIARRPLAVLAWMAAYLLIGVLPHLGVMALILPQWIQMMQEVASSAASHTPMPPAAMMRAQMGMMQLQPLAWLVGVASQAILLSAVYRAVLFPEDSRYFYLRLGGRELWVGLVILVLIVMAALLIFAIALPVGIASAILGVVARDTPPVALVIVLLVLAAIGFFLWVLIRLSLATTMSFADRSFRLYESWSLTHGQAWNIFLVALVLVVIAWIAEMVLGGVAISALGGVYGLQRLAGWFQHPTFNLAVAMPWLAGGVLAVTVFSTLFFVLFGAAWAEIYRELTEEPAAA